MKIFGYSLKKNYGLDGECVRCPKCGSRDFAEDVISRLEYTACEIDIHCAECRALVGFWAYGYYDPCFMFYDKSLPALKYRIICKLLRVSTP